MNREKVLNRIEELRKSDEGHSIWSSKPRNEWAWYVSLRGAKPSFHELIIGEEYLLIDDCGSFYKNGNSIGYFQAGSIMKVLDKNDDYAEISVKGSTFKVNSDASFGNNSATFTTEEGVGSVGNLYETHYRINIIPIKDITL